MVKILNGIYTVKIHKGPVGIMEDMDSQMLTYILVKTQSIVLSGTSRKGQPDVGLHPVQNPDHTLVSNK